MLRSPLIPFVALVLAATPARAKTNHLFSPTPKQAMREMSTDRPDGTESPLTVDAGHVQAELSFFDFTRESGGGVDVTQWVLFETNFKVGLLDFSDLQLVFAPYTIVTVEDAAGQEQTTKGFGDITLRLKFNIWGNDGAGATALGVLPFVKIPTHTDLSNGQTEGGLALVLSWDLLPWLGAATMSQIDLVYDAADDGYTAEYLHTLVFGAGIFGPLGGFLEYIGAAGSADYRALLSTGLIFGLGANLQLDAAVQIGLSEAADDVKFFTGASARL